MASLYLPAVLAEQLLNEYLCTLAGADAEGVSGKEEGGHERGHCKGAGPAELGPLCGNSRQQGCQGSDGEEHLCSPCRLICTLFLV